ncbi:MAG TPA: hypothetical protein VFP84_23830 [Kofleriaceae bacterium]|nr:hypothetical protein [Kofleriaceae bacterium]
MSVAAVSTAFISEPMTWAEICTRYPDEWVCVVEMDFAHPNDYDFQTARVVGRGKTRQAPFDQARPWRAQYEEIGHFFTGRVVLRNPRPVVILDDETRDAFRFPR